MPEAAFSHRTLLIDTLLKASQMQGEAAEGSGPFSITAYHLSNSGQGPALDIYFLPLEAIGFLRDMHLAQNRISWDALVHRAWQVPPAKKGAVGTEPPGFQPRHNYLYEDLFGLPDNAVAFVRTYFLRGALRYARGDQGDPRGAYSLRDEAGLVSWAITACFLRRIMHMDKERVERIRNMGDQLAEYVCAENDRRFFRDFFLEQHYDRFRTALIKANLAHVRRGCPPIVTLDPYIEVFEQGDEVAGPAWRLARDLVLIRMVEQLCQLGWLGRNVEAIPEGGEEQETAGA
jgi:CRISPR-associated protein Cst1